MPAPDSPESPSTESTQHDASPDGKPRSRAPSHDARSGQDARRSEDASPSPADDDHFEAIDRLHRRAHDGRGRTSYGVNGGGTEGGDSDERVRSGKEVAKPTLRRREERFRALVQATSYVIYRVSPDWSVMREVDGQGFIADMTSPTEAWLDEYVPPADQPAVEAAIEEAIRTQSLFDVECRVWRADGTLGWTHSRAVPIRDEEGEIAEWFGAASDITARKQAEQALRESEERYRTLFESINEGFCIVEALLDERGRGVDHRFVVVNPAFERHTGLDDAVGKTARELVPELEDRWPERYGRIATTGTPEHFVMESEAMGRWFEVDAFRVGDPEERKVALLFSDITERKQAEAKLEDANRELKATNRQLQQFARLLETKVEERVEALHQSEQKYRRLFEEAPVGIAVSKPDGTIMDVNATAVEILGYDRAELLSMNASELHAEPGERLRILSQLADNPDRVFELRMQRKSGEEIVVRSSVNMRQGPGGAIIAYQGFFQDISDRKRAKEALEESEAMFRALAEESPTGIAIIQGGRFRFVNQQYADIFGYEREEMLRSLPVLEVVHTEDRHIVRENLRRRIDNEVNAVYFEVRGRTKQGETIYIEVHGARFDYAGQPAVIGSVLDVTERKRLQREVLNMQEAERQRIGHDLHDGVASQLTGIGIMLASLKRSDDVGRDAASRIEEIRQLIEESTEKIRLLSHGLAPTQLSQGTLGKALKRLTDTVDGGRCELVWSEEGGFDEGTRDGEALGENAVAPSDEAASHLYWIAREAVTNAQKHADASAITVRLRREDNTIVLEIEDDGQGFDPDGVDEGRLGLRTMRYRAELMNGTLQIDTTPGEGTCVTCRLPAP